MSRKPPAAPIVAAVGTAGLAAIVALLLAGSSTSEPAPHDSQAGTVRESLELACRDGAHAISADIARIERGFLALQDDDDQDSHQAFQETGRAFGSLADSLRPLAEVAGRDDAPASLRGLVTAQDFAGRMGRAYETYVLPEDSRGGVDDLLRTGMRSARGLGARSCRLTEPDAPYRTRWVE